MKKGYSGTFKVLISLSLSACLTNIIYTMYEDDEGGMWLGTMFGGVNYLPNRGLIFEKYVPLNTRAIVEFQENTRTG